MNNKITLSDGYELTLENETYHITKPGDDRDYILHLKHSGLDAHIFLHYATPGVDPDPIADDLHRVANEAYLAA